MSFPWRWIFTRLVWRVSFLILFISTAPLQAQNAGFEGLGGRFGLSVARGPELRQAETFVSFRLPWSWDLGAQFRLQSRLDFSVGWLGSDNDNAVIGSVVPEVVLRRGGLPVSLELGLGPTLMSRNSFDDRDLGSNFQFTTHIGLNFDLGNHVRLGYRFQHMSNAGIASPNPGLNMNMFAVSYRF